MAHWDKMVEEIFIGLLSQCAYAKFLCHELPNKRTSTAIFLVKILFFQNFYFIINLVYAVNVVR